jgi:DNA-binding transcriptional LysR family regulator
MLDTDQLRSFIAIVDTGSFTKAAERVNKTQSAVSMHVRRLEDQLGRPLFMKHGRGVRLSDDGERLIDYARQMLDVEAAALAAVSRKALAGRVRLGIPDDYAETFLPEILARFIRRHPLVETSIVCDSSQMLAERVNARDLDMAVVTDCSGIHGIEILRETPLTWVTGATSRAHDVRPLPLALAGPHCAWRRAATAALEAAGIAHRLLVVSANYAAIAPVVQVGAAITVLPDGAVRAGHRVLGQDDGMPALALCRIGLLQGSGRKTAEGRALAEEIRAVLQSNGRSQQVRTASEFLPGVAMRPRARAA